MAHYSVTLELNNHLCSHGSCKRPWVGSFFGGSPWPIRLLAPRLMLMLIITHLAQAMKSLHVVDKTRQLSGGRPEHTMVHLGGHALQGGKQQLERTGFPHKRSAWVCTRPQDVISLAKNYECAGDAIELICFVNPLLLICRQPWQPIWVVIIIPQGRRHGCVAILNEPGSGGCLDNPAICKGHCFQHTTLDGVVNIELTSYASHASHVVHIFASFPVGCWARQLVAMRDTMKATILYCAKIIQSLYSSMRIE